MPGLDLALAAPSELLECYVHRSALPSTHPLAHPGLPMKSSWSMNQEDWALVRTEWRQLHLLTPEELASRDSYAFWERYQTLTGLSKLLAADRIFRVGDASSAEKRNRCDARARGVRKPTARARARDDQPAAYSFPIARASLLRLLLRAPSLSFLPPCKGGEGSLIQWFARLGQEYGTSIPFSAPGVNKYRATKKVEKLFSDWGPSHIAFIQGPIGKGNFDASDWKRGVFAADRAAVEQPADALSLAVIVAITESMREPKSATEGKLRWCKPGRFAELQYRHSSEVEARYLPIAVPVAAAAAR